MYSDKNDVFEVLRSNWFRDTHFLFEKKNNSKIWLMWPMVDLTLLCHWIACSQIPKWLLFFYFYVQKWSHNMCRMPKKEFLISIYFYIILYTFVTWHWPSPVLSMALMLTGYLCYSFEVTLAGFRVGVQNILKKPSLSPDRHRTKSA